MVRISNKTKNRLKEDILAILYEKPLISMFTKEIADELRRDKEFTKGLLLEMEKEELVKRVSKNARGRDYSLRIKWVIPKKVLEAMDKNRVL